MKTCRLENIKIRFRMDLNMAEGSYNKYLLYHREIFSKLYLRKTEKSTVESDCIDFYEL